MGTNYAEARRQFDELVEKAQKFDAVMEVFSILDPTLIDKIGREAMAKKKLSAFSIAFGQMVLK